MKKLSLIILLCLTTTCYADTYRGKYNPWTSKLDWVNTGAFDTITGTTVVATSYVSSPIVYANGVSLTPGGGSQTPWTSNINGAGYNLSGAGSITTTSGIVVSSKYYSAQYTTSGIIVWSNGNCQTMTLGNALNPLTFSGGSAGDRLLLQLTQPASGSVGTVTWPASVKWAGGTAPTLTTTSSYVDVFTFYYNGSKYLGGLSLNYAP